MTLRRQLADAISRARHTVKGTDALDDLDYAIEELTQMLRFYEAVLEEHHLQRPYFRHDAG